MSHPEFPLPSSRRGEASTLEKTRNIRKVPFVELLDNRLQGVVSSGSDVTRVYVSYFEAGTMNFSCATNNNRPCSGAGGLPCNHLKELLDEAIDQFGVGTVARFLGADDPTQISAAYQLLAKRGRNTHVFGGEIFSRFLANLELLELPAASVPVPAMAWFQE